MKDGIVEILTEEGDSCTLSYLAFSLRNVEFQDVCDAVDELVRDGMAEYTSNGPRLSKNGERKQDARCEEPAASEERLSSESPCVADYVPAAAESSPSGKPSIPEEGLSPSAGPPSKGALPDAPFDSSRQAFALGSLVFADREELEEFQNLMRSSGIEEDLAVDGDSHPSAVSGSSPDDAGSRRGEIDEGFGNRTTGPVFRNQRIIDVISLPKRIATVCEKEGIATLGDLVSNLASFMTRRGLGMRSVAQLTNSLVNVASCLPRLSEEQLRVLCALSHSNRFVFDELGVLCDAQVASFAWRDEAGQANRSTVDSKGQPSASVGASAIETAMAAETGEGTPIELLQLPDATMRMLKRNRIVTVQQLVGMDDARLLSLRGFGRKKLNDVKAALQLPFSASAFDGCGGDRAEERAAAPNVIEREAPPARVYDDYLSGFSDQAHRVVLSSVERLSVFDGLLESRAYRVMALPFATSALDRGLSSDDAAEAIAQHYEESPELLAACMTRLSFAMGEKRNGDDRSALFQPLAVGENLVWREAARRVAASEPSVVFDEEASALSVALPHMAEWLDTLEEKDAEIIGARLSGATLEECGSRVGLTRERIRQIEKRVLKNRPPLDEDRYLHFVSYFDMKPGDFAAITGKSSRVFRLLKNHPSKLRKSDKAPLGKALFDPLVPDSAKDGIRRFLDKDYVYEDGERIRRARDSIIMFLVKKLASDGPITTHLLYQRYERFLKDHGLQDEKGLENKSERAFVALVTRPDKVMQLSILNAPRPGAGTPSLRYYDYDAVDLSKLRSLLSSGLFADIECSAEFVFHHPRMRDAMEELGLQDGYELHNIVRNCLSGIPGLKLERTPTMVFGNGDRKAQMLELVKELCPASAETLAEAYERRYGVRKEVVLGNYLDDLNSYRVGRVYVYNDEDLTSEQEEFLSSELTGRCHSLFLVKERFKERFQDARASLVNESNLAELGFKISGSLIIEADQDERELFASMIDEKLAEGKGFFNVEDFPTGKEILGNDAFKSELNPRLNSRRLVEYEDGKFLTAEKLASLDPPITVADLEDYVNSAIEFMEPGKPYSLKVLEREGFSHPVGALREDAGLGDMFFNSLLRTGFVGGRLKRASFGDTPLFCRTPYAFNSPDVLDYILKQERFIDIDDLAGLLERRYGVNVSNAVLRQTVGRSSLYYAEAIDIVFYDENEYRKKVSEWI